MSEVKGTLPVPPYVAREAAVIQQCLRSEAWTRSGSRPTLRPIEETTPEEEEEEGEAEEEARSSHR